MAMAIRDRGQGAREEPQARKVINDLSGCDGVRLSNNTLIEHARRLHVTEYLLGIRSELLSATAWVAFLYGMRACLKCLVNSNVFGDILILGNNSDQLHQVVTYNMFLLTLSTQHIFKCKSIGVYLLRSRLVDLYILPLEMFTNIYLCPRHQPPSS